MTTFAPTMPQEVLDAVAWAVAEEAPVEIVGHGSKRGIGRPVQAQHTLDLSKLTGVTLYEPEELVLSARAGTPLADIEALLDENRQQLAFEPMDYASLHGTEPGRGTIGGVLATNLSGPRRIRAGAARDHILGIHAVSGRGEVFRSGGRVVKNVTGYDLSKTLAGSWGTLAAVTDVTFKVLPASETEVTVALSGLDDAAAADAMARAVGSAGEVSGAAHLPEGVARRVLDGSLGGKARTLLRVEGFGPSVEFRAELLSRLLRDGSDIERIGPEDSRRLWQQIRDCVPFADGTTKPVWRVSMPPADGHRMVMALRMQAAVDAFYDWQGGLIWLAMEGDAEADGVRAAIAAHGGGHATLVRGEPSLRAAIRNFQPQPPALETLSSRLRSEFDPNNTLNPGRMN